MNLLTRGTAGACLLLSLTACTTSNPAPAQTPATTTTPSSTVFRYQVNELEAALPPTFGRRRLDPTAYVYPVQDNWTPRRDPLTGRSVLPAECRAIIWNGGNSSRPGEYIPAETPSAGTSAELGAQINDDLAPTVRATIIELTGALADEYMSWFRPTPTACEHVRVDGSQRASVVERTMPGFGERSRYIVRTFPVAGKSWTEHILQYRTATYVVEIRLDGDSVTEPAFLAFARQTQDHVTAALK